MGREGPELGAPAAAVRHSDPAVADAVGYLGLDKVFTGNMTGNVVILDDIAAVVEVGHSAGVVVKVIFETALLDERAKIDACRASADAGADFTKTSTGFAGGGATLADVALMRANTPDSMEVKASGGVRDIPTLLAMLAEGVTRIGTSSTAALLAEARVGGGKDKGATGRPVPMLTQYLLDRASA